MNKEKETPVVDEIEEATRPVEAPKVVETNQSTSTLKRSFLFPDVVNGGPAIVIEATSIDEAQELYHKQKGHA